MPLGPNCLSPMGTDRKRRLGVLCRDIDNYIEASEYNTVYIYFRGLSVAYCDCKKEIVEIYKNAGWLHVYWKCIYEDKEDWKDKLVLSNNTQHIVEDKSKKGFFKKILNWCSVGCGISGY